MGRGRAKAKQTKVARELKYSSPQTDFDRLRQELAGSGELLAADRDGAAPSLERPAVMIGPAGGWSESERARFAGTVGLGPSVLRAETAAFAAAAMLGALRAGLVAPATRQ